jgi:hypothetical protein
MSSTAVTRNDARRTTDPVVERATGPFVRPAGTVDDMPPSSVLFGESLRDGYSSVRRSR